MGLELSPEREDELINKIAEYIVKSDMETVGLFFLESSKPVSYIGTQMLTVFVEPFIAPLVGNWSQDLLVLFYKRENIDRLLKKIEQLSEEKKEKMKKATEGKEGWKEKIKRFITGHS